MAELVDAMEIKTMLKGLPTRILGPYIFRTGPSAGRRYVTVFYSDGSKGTTLYSRYLMEQKLGRRLDPNLETVDHINQDPTDDRIDNLQILSRVEHGRKDNPGKPLVTQELTCIECGDSFYRSGRSLKETLSRLDSGRRGPYCSRSCVGLDSARIQYGN